jgi:Fe-S cluster biogenesis protein NfuA
MLGRLPLPQRNLNEAGRLADDSEMATELSRPLFRRVESALDRLRPALVADGGNVELVDVDEDGVVSVQLQGACATCPAQSATLRYGLEACLRAELPDVSSVVAV